MAERQQPRTGTIYSTRPRPMGRQVYEDFQPTSEKKEEVDAHVLLIRLPGFTRERVRITYVHSSRIVRVTGERPMDNIRWIRFNQAFPVPENCDVEKIHAKFELGVLTITMPKKALETRGPSPKVQEAAIPPKSTPTASAPPLDEPKQEKIQEAVPAKPTATTTAPLPSPQKSIVEQKGEGSTQKPALPINGGRKEAEVKKEGGLLPPKAVVKTQPSKGQDETPEKPSSAKQVDQKREKVRAESHEKLREVKKEAEKAQHAVSSLSKKPVEKAMAAERETKGEPEDSTLPDLAFVLKEDKEIRGAMTDDHGDERKQQEHHLSYTIGKRIKEMSFSATEAMKRMTERLNDEDKQLLINMGAAILVIAALGAYVTYKISSSGKSVK